MVKIPEVRTLCEILPSKSSVSGKEFARIVNLLLFHDARKKGDNLTLFDDRAGDYHGLDAFKRVGRSIDLGFQHKFYPSPLSSNHRKEIEDSLIKSLYFIKENKLKIKKWILVTPQDLVESSVRKSKGDVSWFEGLRKKHNIDFEIEHWGHTHLLSLFIEAPAIGLYYYPELFPNGDNRRKTIKQIRNKYDSALENEYGRIEFVGMSVYKQEAARNVPMEDIYIPISIIPNESEEIDHAVPRQNPVELTSLGTQHVVLGDPGSGKTTLLRFLALVGSSKALQERYNQSQKDTSFHYKEDSRLPIVITLRRYADEMKKKDSTTLIEYIRANIAADFSITNLSLEFLEYYLETGQAILLFDGLDELPNPKFKHTIRNRIQNFGENYPGNTIVVTSRIFGYQGSFNFDKESYTHHRIAKLEIEEIERFVKDWYRVRVESVKDSKEYIESLLAILRNEQHESIRELARNPLLLTIMVLVHRIDAVLPDERHVLYQKCTETLLNTWHTWKFHDMDRLHRAKVDRLNMQRMQEIAYWMQQRLGASESGRQAVVSYEDLHKKLSDYISGETPPNPDYAPEDLATAFIEFVQDRAGLLVEIGDRQFSFLHLTFQEYLTAGHIKTITEPLSIEAAWKQEIEPHCADPRWREVIRLLVSSYGSNQSQEILVDRILSLKSSYVSILLAGLYLDGVASAQMVLQKIFLHILKAIGNSKEESLQVEMFSQLRACLARDPDAFVFLESAVQDLCKKESGDEIKKKLRITLLICDFSPEQIWDLCGNGCRREQAVISLFFSDTFSVALRNELQNDFEILQAAHNLELLDSSFGNFLAIIDWSIIEKADAFSYQKIFISLLSTLVYDAYDGPLTYLFRYGCAFSEQNELCLFSAHLTNPASLKLDRARVLGRARNRVQVLGRARVLDRALGRARTRTRALDRARALDRTRTRALDRTRTQVLARARALDRALTLVIGTTPILFPYNSDYKKIFLQRLWEDLNLLECTIDYLISVFDLTPKVFWKEALKESCLQKLPHTQPLFDPIAWHRLLTALENSSTDEDEIWQVASCLFIDAMFYLMGFHNSDDEWLRSRLKYTDEKIAQLKAVAAENQSILTKISERTRDRTEPALQIAHCIRDLAYGDKARTDDLISMLESDDPQFHKIFVDCYWFPNKKEE